MKINFSSVISENTTIEELVDDSISSWSTISGDEPLRRPKFVGAVLKLKDHSIEVIDKG